MSYKAIAPLGAYNTNVPEQIVFLCLECARYRRAEGDTLDRISGLLDSTEEIACDDCQIVGLDKQGY